MKTVDFFNNITGGATSGAFVVSNEVPMTIAARGLAGAETVKLQVLVNGTYADVYTGGALKQLTATGNIMLLDMSGTFKLVASATAGALFVEGSVNG